MFREFLRNYRVKNNLTQKQMAELCNTSQAYYSQIENGSRNPGFVIIRKLSAVLGVTEEFLRRLV